MASTKEQREMRDEVLRLLDARGLDIQYFNETFACIAHRRGIFYTKPTTEARYGVLFRSVKSLVMTALNRRKLSKQEGYSSTKKPAEEPPKRTIFDFRMAAAGEKKEDYA